MGAEGFDVRVRDGIGCGPLAVATRSHQPTLGAWFWCGVGVLVRPAVGGPVWCCVLVWVAAVHGWARGGVHRRALFGVSRSGD